MIKKFYKDKTGWYVDLPDEIAAGIFAKGNCAMVMGADTLLDKMAGKKKSLFIQFENEPFEGYTDTLVNSGTSMDEEALTAVDHPIELGGDYRAIEREHNLWLCGVCAHLFGGEFPKVIYVKIVKSL